MNEKLKSGHVAIEAMSFEECYLELQQLVEQFEKGQMRLAESVEHFERGMLLLKRCNQQLNEAETRVEKLMRRIEPVEASDSEPDRNSPDSE